MSKQSNNKDYSWNVINNYKISFLSYLPVGINRRYVVSPKQIKNRKLFKWNMWVEKCKLFISIGKFDLELVARLCCKGRY